MTDIEKNEREARNGIRRFIWESIIIPAIVSSIVTILMYLPKQ